MMHIHGSRSPAGQCGEQKSSSNDNICMVRRQTSRRTRLEAGPLKVGKRVHLSRQRVGFRYRVVRQSLHRPDHTANSIPTPFLHLPFSRLNNVFPASHTLFQDRS